jgi:hypothetical protein
MKKLKSLLMLVALLALTTQTWATEPTVYTTAVSRDDLNVGDILIGGATITTNEWESELRIAGGSYKLGESIANEAADIFNYAPLTIGENGIFSISNQNYTPYDNTAQKVGNAWVVTGNDMDAVSIAGTTYTVVDPNAVAVTPTENANEWSFTMPAGNIVLQVEYCDPVLTLASNSTTMGTVGIEKQQGEEQIGVVVQPDAVVFVYIPADAHRLFLADVVNDAQHVERLTLILLVVGSDGVTLVVDNADRSTSFER